MDVIRDALTTHLAATPAIASKAEALRAEIDADANAQQETLSGLLRPGHQAEPQQYQIGRAIPI